MVAEAVRVRALRPETMVSKPVRVDPVFEDPDAIYVWIRSKLPVPTMPGALGELPLRAENFDMPWFLRIERDPSDPLLDNPAWIDAARNSFGAAIVNPLHCVINFNGAAPAGPPHLDVPSFRGMAGGTYPIWLLTSMFFSGLFMPWLVPQASGVGWFWRGEGGGFEYWPDGPDRPSAQEAPPMWNLGVMSDNEAMYHRVTRLGGEARAAELAARMTLDAEIHATPEGWEIRRGAERVASLAPDEVRISLVWKALVFKDEAHLASFEDTRFDLDVDQVTDALVDDLKARGLSVRRPEYPLGDTAWRKLLVGTYRSRFA